MVNHEQRLQAAHDAIDVICNRSDIELNLAVPNCPGWTIYNAAVHVGRVGIAWKSMIEASPDDPDSRVRGYADAESRGSGHPSDVLASWAHDAVDALDADVEQASYFSMTGGHGTVGLWAWHAASELGIHRLDIENALGVPYAMSEALAIDALEYTCQYFLPAMARATATDPGVVEVIAECTTEPNASLALTAPSGTSTATVAVAGAPVDVLLSLWGRAHSPITTTGDTQVLERWRSLPAEAFQFGTWD